MSKFLDKVAEWLDAQAGRIYAVCMLLLVVGGSIVVIGEVVRLLAPLL